MSKTPMNWLFWVLTLVLVIDLFAGGTAYAAGGSGLFTEAATKTSDAISGSKLVINGLLVLSAMIGGTIMVVTGKMNPTRLAMLVFGTLMVTMAPQIVDWLSS